MIHVNVRRLVSQVFEVPCQLPGEGTMCGLERLAARLQRRKREDALKHERASSQSRNHGAG